VPLTLSRDGSQGKTIVNTNSYDYQAEAAARFRLARCTGAPRVFLSLVTGLALAIGYAGLFEDTAAASQAGQPSAVQMPCPAVTQVKPADAPPPTPPPQKASTQPSVGPPQNPASGIQRRAAAGGEERRPLFARQGRATTQPARTTQPATDSSGCGGRGVRPPPPEPSPEGPQPRYVCKEPKITAEPVWHGAHLDYVFEIGNEGEGDLRILLRGG
jgi:hypothetical protein